MFYRTLNWYRTLKFKWKVFAWIIVVVVAIVSFVLFALPWIISGRLRKKVRTLQAKAAFGKAEQKLKRAELEIESFEAVRDKALKSEKKHAKREKQLSAKIALAESRLINAKQKVEDQTNAQQSEFFNNRYRH